MTGKILIVDDDPVQRRLLESLLDKLGYVSIAAEDGQQAIDILQKSKPGEIELMLLDLVMPDLDGFEILARLKKVGNHIPVIVQTARGGIETVVSAIRAGAHDFIVKPVSPERIKTTIESALCSTAAKVEGTRKRKATSKNFGFEDIISSSPSMQNVVMLGRKAAKSNIPILIEGESGVGKEMIARAIQGTSNRADRSFITVNCGALPENLIESVLFGHEKGSFTGASHKHIGKFEEADGGTLFLDEVGELPLSTQVKLLRALQEGEVDPIGAAKSVKTNFRLISATNRRLQDEIQTGSFREDLFYRLSVYPIWVPPLRERMEEIPELAAHFLVRFTRQEKRTHIRSISPDAIRLLMNNDWPGNIRQLENTIFRAVILCEGSELVPEDFPQLMTGKVLKPSAKSLPAIEPTPNTQAFIDDDDEPAIRLNLAETPPLVPEIHNPVPEEQDQASTQLINAEGEIKELEDVEAEMIRFALELYNGKLSEVAKRLGIGRSTLYRRLKELGIDQESNNPV